MKQYWGTGIIIALIIGGSVWFFSTHERVIDEIPSEYQGEARVNRFLAAEMLLEQLDLSADSRSSLVPSDWLPGQGDTIVVQLATAFSAGEAGVLLDSWILDGGHLVLLPPRETTRQANAWLESLGFRFTQKSFASEEDEQDEQDDSSEEQDYLVDLGSTWNRIEIVDVGGPTATLSDDDGHVAVRREWGAGFVTVLAHYSYFDNDALAEPDHARLLLDVVAGYVEPGKVWFIYNASFPPLWSVIWSNAPLLVIAAAVLFLLWLWSVMPVFGPRIRRLRDARRSIAEHVKAAGLFVWRHHGADVLAKSATDALLHDAEMKHPGISRLPVAGQARLIARMTDQPEQLVLDVLANQGELRHREFTHDIQKLQTLRKEL